MELPEEYPQEACTLRITNEEIPEKIKIQITEQSLKRAQVAYKSKPMILGLLKWLDNNLEKLLVDKTMTQDFQLAQSGIQIFTPQQIKQHLTQETEGKYFKEISITS